MFSRQNCAMYFQSAWLIPLMTQKPPNEKSIKSWKTKMENTLDQVTHPHTHTHTLLY